MKNDSGITHRAASASRQSKKNILTDISNVDSSEPTSSGIQCEDAVSSVAQSAIIVLVKSDRSFFPKKDSGKRRSFSASVTRRTPLSR